MFWVVMWDPAEAQWEELAAHLKRLRQCMHLRDRARAFHRLGKTHVV